MKKGKIIKTLLAAVAVIAVIAVICTVIYEAASVRFL